MFKFYPDYPLFSSLNYMNFNDKKLLRFINRTHFSPNALWAADNPTIHCWIANEFFFKVRKLLQLIPERINPNLCDGDNFGKKSILILLTLFPSEGLLVFEFIELYQNKLDFNYQDRSGKSALHYAVILGRYDLVTALLRCGASAEIIDSNHKKPFDYLHCPDGSISDTLKSVDIEPARDKHASRNRIVDNENNALFIKGKVLTQNKSDIETVLERDDLVFTHYIKKSESWADAVGDNTEATHDYFFEVAQKIATHFKLPPEAIFIPESCSEEYSIMLREKLEALRETFSGVSVLENCRNGHAIIEQNLEQATNTPAFQGKCI